MPSRYMPRWASRLMLEITGVRVERLQEIDEAGANEEGYTGALYPCARCTPTHYEQDALRWFRHRWDTLNAERGYGWDADPWVWVIEFKVVGGDR